MDRGPGAGRVRDGARAGEHTQDFATTPAGTATATAWSPTPAPVTRQDFGHRTTNHAGGKEPGEIGGRDPAVGHAGVVRQGHPGRKTLNDRLTASGRFAVTGDDGASGMLFGWFNDDSRGWRTPNSLAFRLDGNGGKYWVFFEYGTRHWLDRRRRGASRARATRRRRPSPSPPTARRTRWTLDLRPRRATTATA